jgi:hypothetical protein
MPILKLENKNKDLTYIEIDFQEKISFMRRFRSVSIEELNKIISILIKFEP